MVSEDFGNRLILLKENGSLSWEGLATCIGVDHRQLLRWCEKGAEPSGGAMFALVALAVQVLGDLEILLGWAAPQGQAPSPAYQHCPLVASPWE